MLRNEIYDIWHAMMGRCYKKHHPSYKFYGAMGVIVAEEWHDFNNFYDWFCKNYYEIGCGTELDKDLLGGNIYSTSTCLFIPSNINKILVKRKREKGLGQGIRLSATGKFNVRVYTFLPQYKQHVGNFDTLEEALVAQNTRKNEVYQLTVDLYEGLIPTHVFKILKEYRF